MSYFVGGSDSRNGHVFYGLASLLLRFSLALPFIFKERLSASAHHKCLLKLYLVKIIFRLMDLKLEPGNTRALPRVSLIIFSRTIATTGPYVCPREVSTLPQSKPTVHEMGCVSPLCIQFSVHRICAYLIKHNYGLRFQQRKQTIRNVATVRSVIFPNKSICRISLGFKSHSHSDLGSFATHMCIKLSVGIFMCRRYMYLSFIPQPIFLRSSTRTDDQVS